MTSNPKLIENRKKEVSHLTDQIREIFSGYHLNYDYLFITGETNNKWNPRRIEYNNFNFTVNNLSMAIAKYYSSDEQDIFLNAIKSLLKSFFLYLESQTPLGDHTFISIVKLTSVLTKDKYNNNYWKLLENDLLNRDDSPLYKDDILKLYEEAMQYDFDTKKLTEAVYEGIGYYCIRSGCACYSNDDYFLFLDELCSMIEKLKDKQYLW